MAGRKVFVSTLFRMVVGVHLAPILCGKGVRDRAHGRTRRCIEGRALGGGAGDHYCEEVARGNEKRQPRGSRHGGITLAEVPKRRQIGPL